ncbi:PREDICTED: putative nuclease HARBI1 isoform X1 [Trachymyrmex cornetzi]|uniref:putative nuclease HARBI1 isoform X1 n=1 Tax=Trachymyrmex cornetzi TaxID=471704 RepID=UPI00084F35FF|nr:PREDICTED: putative nuclease HARBI1 isoform X1 [Trachymyrmex cornetzi]
MMTPIIDAIEGSPEAEYNRKQMKCRSLIEQCNGVLKMRFRCLLKHRVLHYSPPTASKIIYTCAVLHNMCINENVPLYLNDDDEAMDFGMYNNENHIENEENIPERNVRRIDPDLAAGRNKQRLMIANYFS